MPSSSCVQALKNSLSLDWSGLLIVHSNHYRVDCICQPRVIKLLKDLFLGSFFSISSQHDAHEFLMYLLDGFHEDLNRTPPMNGRHASTHSAASVTASLSEPTTPTTDGHRCNITISLLYKQIKRVTRCN